MTGVGEFLGYALRLVSGYFIDRTKLYWPVTIFGYGLLIAVPMLAVAGNWQLAVAFIMLERIGKAIRSPAKDALLSHATKQVGTGFGFGLHEALDQIGAVIGPLLFTAGLAFNGGYELGFHLMWVPAILTILVVVATRFKFPDPSLLEDDSSVKTVDSHIDQQGFSRTFWLYAIFTFLSVLGFASFQLISYHLQVKGIVVEAFIPSLYAIAMAVDAVVALIVGNLYDKKGMSVLLVIPILSVPIPFLGFSENYILVVVAVVLWGAVMGIHETIMRAAIADLIPITTRGTAYGIFNTLYGLAWFLGSTAVGYLYNHKIGYVFGFIVIVQLMACICFLYFKNSVRQKESS